MKNKSLSMFVSAILIAVFHLWINITSFEIENFIKFICFVGVDIFFLVSAFSIAKSDTENYKEYIKKRFSKIYLKYIFFAIIASIVFGWGITRLIKVVLGIELFTKGGGSFLWFAPAILIVYLLLPLYKRMDETYPKANPVITLSLWFAIYLVLTKVDSVSQILIFYNRIPVILLGFYLGKYDVLEKVRQSKFRYILLSISAICIGIILVYFLGYHSSNDFFYILAIPLALGLVMILDILPETRIIDKLGKCSFEMYGLQMIFGFKIADIIYRSLGSAILSNIITIGLLIATSFLLEKAFHILK